MAFVRDPRRAAFGCAAVLLTALLFWFGTGMTPWWPLLWFAPLPVLLFAAGARGWTAALVAGAGWFLGSLNVWHHFAAVLAVPIGAIIGNDLTFSIVFALAVLLHRALLRRGAHIAAVCALPATWVAFEYLVSHVSPHGTGGNLAYTQLAFLPFLQLASVTGPWGITFFALLFPSALAVAWTHRRTQPRNAPRVLAATIVVLAAILAFGFVRLARPIAGTSAKVGLVASDGPNEDVAAEGEATQRLFWAYAEPVARLAARGAEVVVIPEKLGVDTSAAASADGIFQPLADRTGVVIVAGMIAVDPPHKFNEARVYRPREPVLRYDKKHMLPPFESHLTPGTTLVTLPRDATQWSVAICKDMDFPAPARDYGEAGSGLLLVPGWDFFDDWIQHGHMAILRGVEYGFGVARAAKGGSLYVSDNRGRILAETKSNSAPFATLLATVPDTHSPTPYLRWGDWFAGVSLALLGIAVARLFLGRRR
jgi:apolipoprotein N-acyltransferase